MLFRSTRVRPLWTTRRVLGNCWADPWLSLCSTGADSPTVLLSTWLMCRSLRRVVLPASLIVAAQPQPCGYYRAIIGVPLQHWRERMLFTDRGRNCHIMGLR